MYDDIVLAHYSAKPELQPYSQEQDRGRPDRKPQGLWVSVEGGEYGWREWGLENSYGCFDHRFVVTLTPESNVLITEDLEGFHRRFSAPLPTSDPDWRYELIDWAAVAGEYQGIIVPRYCWEHRFDTTVSNWYYGWDCASGCIWDATAVESVTYDTKYEAPVDAPDMAEREIPF